MQIKYREIIFYLIAIGIGIAFYYSQSVYTIIISTCASVIYMIYFIYLLYKNK